MDTKQLLKRNGGLQNFNIDLWVNKRIAITILTSGPLPAMTPPDQTTNPGASKFDCGCFDLMTIHLVSVTSATNNYVECKKHLHGHIY